MFRSVKHAWMNNLYYIKVYEGWVHEGGLQNADVNNFVHWEMRETASRTLDKEERNSLKLMILRRRSACCDYVSSRGIYQCKYLLI